MCSVQPCPPLMAPLASGCRARRSAHGVVLQRRLPTGSVHGTHRARLRTGTHKSMAPLMRVPCNAPINGRRATARSAIGAIAHRAPLVASVVPALRGVQRCGDSALRRFGASALRRFVVCGAVVMRRCKTLCGASPCPRCRTPALWRCRCVWRCGVLAGWGRSCGVAFWALWGSLGVLGMLGPVGVLGRAGRVGRACLGRGLLACFLGVHAGRAVWAALDGPSLWACALGLSLWGLW